MQPPVEWSGVTGYALPMDSDDNDEHRGLWSAIRERSGVILGVVGLVAWCAMIWFMFGDVL
ncbi:hypothetical protein U5A82_11785 [Sphingobium sp. CR2-8]|uniref:hypothetical protein n=1 Tax=Sphingobium sp. CR2-8 TaxID=1306534 RepID=UPI002DB6A4B4|nr:hypothetical protein [Sphingobium sp. CR2-8]MEC3911124.1 hypothetical protein [Sphingobium sp. CR2-8]